MPRPFVELNLNVGKSMEPIAILTEEIYGKIEQIFAHESLEAIGRMSIVEVLIDEMEKKNDISPQRAKEIVEIFQNITRGNLKNNPNKNLNAAKQAYSRIQELFNNDQLKKWSRTAIVIAMIKVMAAKNDIALGDAGEMNSMFNDVIRESY